MKVHVQSEFLMLLGLVSEGQATTEELALFRNKIAENPELLDLAMEQMWLQAVLEIRGRAKGAAAQHADACGGGGLDAMEERVRPVAAVPAVSVAVGTAGTAGAAGRRLTARFSKVAALAALLALTATGLWLAAGGGRSAAAVTPVAGRPSPVEILHRWGSCNLEVPERLPGTLRMTNGRITARLSSGIELVLLGPFELEIRTPMEARLLSGRLLAEVSKSAGGFMLHTPDFEMWDNGALFGVTVTEEGSDVFVFDGEVQVVEACGEPVDICRAGEGARVRRDGSGAVKIAADLPAAERMLATASERGVLKDPEMALKAAVRISDLWAAEWMPKVVTPARPVPGLRGSRQLAIGNRQSAMGNRQLAIANRQSASWVRGPGSATIASKGAALCPPPKGTTLNSGGVAPAATKTIAALTPQKEEEEMKATVKTVAAVTAAALMGAGSAWAVPEVSNVNMTQLENTRTVQVTYELSVTNAIVTLSIETNGVAIPDSAVTRLSGDVCKVVAPGSRTITWNAGADWPENVTENAKARVTAWSVDAPPLYCAVDVAGGTSAQTYPVYYYPSAEGVPGGVTNDLYKTTSILMRKLPPTGGEGFKMGSPSNETGRDGTREDWHNVVLTKAFYAGVYPVTQSQWQQVMSDVRPWPSTWSHNDYRLTRPVEQVSYNDIRGSSAGAGWPGSDAVDAATFIGRLRSKAGLAGADLPTDAQWEYACRAGATGALNDGTVNLTNTTSDARLDALGRYAYNGGKINGTTDPAANCTTANATSAVGSYQPNAWGLYDTHGNVWEWCLDWYVGNLGTGAVTDPVGADSGSGRVRRGGGWGSAASNCRSASRNNNDPSFRDSVIGFRLVRTLP